MEEEIKYKGLGIVDLATHALQKPDDFGWWGSDEMFVSWGWTGIDKDDSSRADDIVNFDLIAADLMERFPFDFDIVGIRHWAVGHVKRLTCRILINVKIGLVESNITEAFKEAMRWLMKLDDYPIVDDDKLYEYCRQEMFDWIMQEIPSEVYIRDSKEETVDQILSEFESDYSGDFDVVCWNLEGKAPDDEMIRYVAYDLSLCAASHRDFWDEWVDEKGLPPIYWGDNFGAPANAVHKINGQLSLFDGE